MSESLRKWPLTSLRQVAAAMGITFPTATKAMRQLAELGIARELIGQWGSRAFVYDAYLEILNEGGEAL